jgi:hypothetical protein
MVIQQNSMGAEPYLPKDASELRSVSSLLKVDKAMELETDPYLLPADDPGAAIFDRLRRERVVLLCDLTSIKAKFELTLQTLRATLRLHAEATWADVLEHTEALVEHGVPLSQAPGADGEARRMSDVEEEADAEKEMLEEKLEAHSSHIVRLRELLHRQQKLLDMTAHQISDQHQQSKRQADHITELEQVELSYEELTSHYEQLQQEAQTEREKVKTLEEQLTAEVQRRIAHDERFRDQAEQIADLREQIAARESDCKSYSADLDKQSRVIKELTRNLATQNEANDQYREQLQVYEAAERRAFSYAARTPPEHRPRIVLAADDPMESSPGHSSVNVPLSSRYDPIAAEVPSAALRARARPEGPMDDNERDAFLSHFPMASRTERAMRNRMEVEKRKKLGHR